MSLCTIGLTLLNHWYTSDSIQSLLCHYWFAGDAILLSSLQDTILEFIYDAYEKEAETLVVPDSIRMNKEMRNSREANALKAYRPRNRYREDSFCWLLIFILVMNCVSVL